MGPCERAECLLLGGECLHEGVGQHADGGHPQSRGRGHVAGPRESGQCAQAGGLEPGLRAMGPAKREIHDRMPAAAGTQRTAFDAIAVW